MILSNEAIRQRIDAGVLTFTPPIDRFQLQQHSVDLRLGFTFMIPKLWQVTSEGRVAVVNDHLTPSSRKQQFDVIELVEGQCFEILPGEYVAVTTLESIKLPDDVMGVLYPRSSVNRRGLSVDLTGIVDAGYEGNLLIPVTNRTSSQVIRMYPGERFCQIVFDVVADLSGVTQSRWHKKDVVFNVQNERSEDEMLLVREGRITELKRDFALSGTGSA
jgi:dCTP deaminase